MKKQVSEKGGFFSRSSADEYYATFQSTKLSPKSAKSPVSVR